MAGSLERWLRHAAASGASVRPETVIGALIALRRVTKRRPASIRALDIENLRYYGRALSAGPDRVVWTSLYAPSELYAAFDLPALCLEGAVGVLAAAGAEQGFLHGRGAETAPNTMCTFHRAIIGLGLSGFLARPRLVVSASALCDGNGVSFRHVAAHHGVPFVFLHVPSEPARGAVGYLADQLRRLASTLEAVTGRRLDPVRLATAVANAREALGSAGRLFGLRASRSQPVFRGHQMINLMFPLNAMLGTTALCDTLRRLIRDVERARPPRQRPAAARVRILWAHIAPVYNYDAVWAVVDDGRRASVVAEECSHWDPLEGGGDDFEWIARRLIAVPQNGPLDRRLDRLERLRRQASADAVVHFAHWGCHQAAGAAPVMERFFTERGVPFLNLNGDCVDSSSASREQHATRVEAFLESQRA